MTWLQERQERSGIRSAYGLSERSLQVLQLELLDQIHERLIEIHDLLRDGKEDPQ